MKTVSKLFTAAAIAFSAVACQVIDEGQAVKSQLKVTATIAEDEASKVDYAVDNENYVISPTWHYEKEKPGECDQIIGFDNDGKTFTFTVSGVSGDGKYAKFDIGTYVPPTTDEKRLYAIYAPGYTTDNISNNNTLEIDLASQGGVLDGSAPVLMCATGTIKDGKVNFQFTNQTAIIGVKQFKLNGVSSATEVTSMTLNGVVTTGTFQVVDNNLVLTPGTDVNSITATGSWTTGASGICATSVYFAAMPTTGADMTLSAHTASATYDNLSSINQVDIVAGRYYHMTKKLGHPVAAIGRDRYDTINDAFDAADCSDEDCTITLLNDCSTTRNPQIRGTNGSGDITIDLNGKTLTMSHQFGVYDSNITICDNSSAVLAEQGKITSAVSTVASYFFSGSSLTLEGGTLENTANQIALYLTSSSSAVLKGGCVKSDENRAIYVNACSLSVPANSTVLVTAKNHSIYSNNGTANIAGGSFDSGNGGSPAITSAGSSSEVTITGGYFSTEHTVLLGVSSSGKFYVSNGFFSAPMSTARAIDKEENIYYNTLNTDSSTKAKYPFTLAAPDMPDTYAALVTSGSTNFQCDGIECAIKAADVNAKASGISDISLNTDCTATAAMAISSGNTYGVTLDLNGHTVYATGVSPLIAAASDFTLMDSGVVGELNTTGIVALSVTAGTTTINGGSLVGATNAASVTGGTLKIYNGHFYGGNSSDIDNDGGSVEVSGGWFHNAPDSFVADGYASESGSWDFNNKLYSYKVAASETIATVNDVKCGSLAAAIVAANAYSEAAETVTIKIVADDNELTHNETIELNNISDKPIVFDLNGHTLSTSTAQFITATGTSLVTITDSEETKGKITSSAKNIISLTTAGANITLDGCIIESTADASDSNLDAPILLNYTSSTDRPQLTIENGAQVYTENTVTAIYGKYSRLTLNSCEITSGTQNSGSYGVFVTTGLILNVNANASIYSTGSSAIYCGSGNAATSIQINGGYLYGTPAALTAGSSGAYSARFTIDGGFFNTDVSTISGSTAATINGSIIPCTDGSHTPQPTGDPLVYSYKFTTSVAEVNGQGYDTLADAVDAAVAYSDEGNVTITLLKSLTHNESITLKNNNSKVIILDLNGQTLTAGVARFIQGTNFTITDTEGTGKIESAFNEIIYPNYKNGSATLNGCKIVSTIAKGTYYYSSRAIACYADNCTLTITGNTVIEANQTCVYCASTTAANSPKVIINDAKITSTESYCIYVSASGEVTVEDGTFHSTGYICGYIGNANATFTIKHGYFSTGSTYSLLYGATGAREDRYFIQGGYYSKALHNSISGYATVVQLSSPVTIDGITYTHAHTSEINP